MSGIMDRASDWRRRAEHLRATAGRMPTSSAQANLLDAATALDQRAADIERQMTNLRKARGSVSSPSIAPLVKSRRLVDHVGERHVRLKQRLAFSQTSLRARSPTTLGHSRILSIELGNHDSKWG